MTPDTDLIEDYVEHLADIGRSPRTIRTYGNILRAAHRELPEGVARATPDEIAEWIARCCRTDDSRRTYLAAFRSFGRWAVAAGHLTRHDSLQLRRAPQPQSLPDPCSDDELAAILAHAPEPERTWSLCAAYLGCRSIEISRLHREHIGADRTPLHGKRDKHRRVPTHQLVWEAIQARPPGPLVPGHVDNGDYVSGRLRYLYLHHIGVDVRAHQLRHWYGTTLVASGAGIEEVQNLMGHSRLSTTLGYVLVASPRLTAAVSRLPAVG